YRIHLEDRCLAAGIRRVKSVKKLGLDLGNWLMVDEARRLLQSPESDTLKGKRDRAILAVLLGCGLRRRELADLKFSHLQRREEHWAIVDLVGKGGRIRTGPVPDGGQGIIVLWTAAARISQPEGCVAAGLSAKVAPLFGSELLHDVQCLFHVLIGRNFVVRR